MDVRPTQRSGSEGPERLRGHSFSTTLEINGQFAVSQTDSAAVLGAGATANLVCFEWLDKRNSFLQNLGSPKVMPYPTTARLKFGDGRVGEVRFAADIEVGIAGCRGAFTDFVLDADIPALLCEGALEALGGQLDFERDILTIREHGVDVPLSANEMGHYILSAVALGKWPDLAASYFEWSLVEKRPDLSDGGLHLPITEGGPLRFVTPKEFPACTAVTLGHP